MNRRTWIAALSLFLPRLARASASAAAMEAAKARLAAAAAASKLPFPLKTPRIRIHKADRALELLDGDAVVKRYVVALGQNPTGPKRKQGDYRTPEGSYRVCYRNEGSQFHLFLGLSYPNAADARAGKDAKLVDAATADRVAATDKAGSRPPWNTALGGEVGIHGGGVGQDWTWGCIALADEDIDELWTACPVDTPVEIQP